MASDSGQVMGSKPPTLIFETGLTSPLVSRTGDGSYMDLLYRQKPSMEGIGAEQTRGFCPGLARESLRTPQAQAGI